MIVKLHLFRQTSKAQPVGGVLGRRRSEERLAPRRQPFLHHRDAPLLEFALAQHPRTLHVDDRGARSNDEPKDAGEQLSRHRDLGHLERNLAAMACRTRTDLGERLRATW